MSEEVTPKPKPKPPQPAEQPYDFASEDWKMICDMTHDKVPCTREGKYFVTLHHCKNRVYYPAGIRVICCQEFIDRAKNSEYPFRCSGCQHMHGCLLDLVWDIENL